ncbi:muts domain V-domain-containing protein [Chaetomidium leptoderma]|uniref:DNA mismatch repair protein MSH5 n=1 Tax=Chaetomidium leptoderma TaxID=669021 RepID=A0AAN6VVN3_9PEZI|nr:muts domain V-domain-containing protein [Chaetomidium leptoderma]
MAIDVDKDGKVGCAYYVAMDETLVLEEDISMGGIEAVDTLLLHVQPTSVIIPNRAPGDLIEFLERDAHRFDDNEESVGEHGAYVLRHLVSAQFDYEAGKEALAKVDLGLSKPDPVEILSWEDEPAQSIGSAAHHKLMRLAESINLKSCRSVGCAGAVLNDLERRRAAEDPSSEEEEGISFLVRSIEMNTSADTLLVSADSLISLQILQSELHPNPQTRSSNSSEPKAKETLSITGLLQALASSAQGKRKLRQMLLRPTTNLALIKERHRSIEVLLRAENGEIAKNMRKLLRKLKNTKTLLLHVRKGVDRVRGQLSIRVGDWKALLRFAMVSAQLQQATHALKGASAVAIFSRICIEINIKRFLHIGDIIIRTIDFQLSKESGHTEILPGASEYLDGLRREFADVCHLLPQLKEYVVQEVPREAVEYIRHCTVMPQLGFLTAVTIDPTTGEGVYHGQNHPEGEWMMCFFSEDVAYYKNQLMLDLDSQYGDLPSRIADEEIEVVMALAAAVLEHEEAILSASELFGELDSLLAFALASEKYNWTAPTMTTSNLIDIVDGRHPLQELLVPSYIPNDCVMAGGRGTGSLEEDRMGTRDRKKTPSPSMLILTGPNNSGKSVYMRQVALIVYLAHTGCYVPASRATIGVTDRILTRIATRETVVNDESAFLVDLKQAAFSMNFATRRSLLLIDEFGKGTTAESGSALFAAYLTYFLDLGMERPKVLAGTHFHEVFENGLLQPGKDLAFAHMDVHLDPEAEDPEEQVTFLYRLLPGRGSSSLGILCAAANGVPSDVINRAKAIVALLDRNESLVEACSDLSEEDKQRLEQAELVARRFLAMQVPSSGHGQGGSGTIRDMLRAVLAPEEVGTLGT